MKTFVAFLLLFFAINRPTFASVDPRLEWKVMHSPHFHLIYDAQQQELADFYLERLERAREKLRPLWTEMPDQLTIVLNDRTDLTNGFATPIPYPQIGIYPVLPGPQESISEYGDWAEEVLIHELTHVLSFEQRRGVPYGLYRIFGTIMTPNVLLPNWWLEGVAVDAETRLSNYGRLRSNYQDATLRALVSSPRWEKFRYPEINETSIPNWPYGSRPYLFGSLMWSEMIALKGEKMINDLHVRFGGRAPFFLTSPIEENFDGQDLPALFERTKKSVEERVLEQKKDLEKTPFSPVERFVDADFLETFTPSISPDGLRMAFIAKDDTTKRSVQVLERPSTEFPFEASQRMRSFGQKREITTPGQDLKIPHAQDLDSPPGGTINRISWFPDSQSFVFDLIQEKDIFHDVSDLWIYSFEKAKGRALTKNMRAREPQVSPDGKRVAYVKLEKDRTSLAILELDSAVETIVYRPQLMGRVSWPVWLDDDRILFSTRAKGHESLAWKNLKSGEMQAPDLQVTHATLPVKKGERVYFVSSENGVRNLYETDLQFKKSRPVTHLWTGAYASEVDTWRNELWVTQIGEMGFELTKLPIPKEVKESKLPKVEPLMAKRYPKREESAVQPVTEKSTTEFNPLPYLVPQYWLPFISWDDKGVQFSAATSAVDPLQKNAYSIYGAYDTAINRGSYQVTYANQSFWPTLILQSTDLSSYLANPDQRTRAQVNFIGSSWEMAFLDPYLFVTAGWIWLSRNQFDLDSYQNGPTLRLSYYNAQESGRQVSPESGGGFELATSQYNSSRERDRFNQSTLSLIKYGKMPWGRHHAWMFRGVGQYLDHDVSIANYDSTLSTLAGAIPNVLAYQMRGYVTGAFLGKNIANTSLEYRFPISRIDRGPEHGPLFFQRITGAAVADGIWLDGYAYDITSDPRVYRRVSSMEGFGSAGIEAKMDFTLGYKIPFELIVGLYQPLTKKFNDGNPRMGIGIGL